MLEIHKNDKSNLKSIEYYTKVDIVIVTENVFRRFSCEFLIFFFLRLQFP